MPKRKDQNGLLEYGKFCLLNLNTVIKKIPSNVNQVLPLTCLVNHAYTTYKYIFSFILCTIFITVTHTYCPDKINEQGNVSLEKNVGSKGKQHSKCTASETQTHTMAYGIANDSKKHILGNPLSLLFN